ncbi:VWA domain-containing protein [Actinomyces viscosus]|uniref:VWA domain containing CoxE-like protein n=1 Tax=Actinomyces viscosus TaxID=1656 RepID=A0A3S4Z2G0_ACTVI|nr:VWA domain-containing protein [Actinomyces viscosus]TFH52633.1 VWA domain-containing protein [Actinomyces viscosus]VEI16828.1 VWA domain containing CoxE-like protein [Actinomyces viscosus]
MVMPWLFGILVALAVVAVIAVLVRDRRSNGLSDPTSRKPLRLPWRHQEVQDAGGLPRRLANSASLFQLPAVRSRIRFQRRLHALLAVLLAVCLLSASAIAGRPVRVTERSDALANRDIVLCLDVSTSMVKIDSSVLTTFADILEDFDGERVGLVAWNSAAQTIVPLTDDYELLRQQMDDLSDVLDIDPDNPTYKQALRYSETFSGTQNQSVNGSSLAGDGLASCAQAFDNQGLERSRSIILATDNQVIDPDNEQIYSLPDAVNLLAERKIRLFSIYGADDEQSHQYELDQSPEASREELKTVTEGPGRGRFYDVEDSGTGGDIVKQLEKTEVSALGGRKQTRRTDIPQRLVITLSLVLLGYLGLTTWRRA